jgi:cephalosporin-C deacetylase
VYGAFNSYTGADKSLSLWTYNGHEGGGIIDEERAIAFFNSTLVGVAPASEALPVG